MLTRVPIILALSNKYDYAEFVSACKTADVWQWSWPEYATKVTMLEYAMQMNPDLEPLEAYKLEISNNNGSTSIPRYQTKVVTTDCSTCGGGRVR